MVTALGDFVVLPYDSSNKLRVPVLVLGLQVTFSRTWNAVGSRLSPTSAVKSADPAINGLGYHLYLSSDAKHGPMFSITLNERLGIDPGGHHFVVLNVSDMADSCQQKYSFLPNCFPAVLVVFKSRVLSETEPVWRRLITLIFAGWLPPDLASSRSCLSLST